MDIENLKNIQKEVPKNSRIYKELDYILLCIRDIRKEVVLNEELFDMTIKGNPLIYKVI